jgi:hypothetical protein
MTGRDPSASRQVHVGTGEVRATGQYPIAALRGRAHGPVQSKEPHPHSPRPANGWGYGWLDPHREAARRIALDAYTALADEQPETSQAVRLLHTAMRLDHVDHHLRARLNAITPTAGCN